MKKLYFIFIITLSCIILCLCASCSTQAPEDSELSFIYEQTIGENLLLPASDIELTDIQILEQYALKLKGEIPDREIWDINKPVFAQWFPMGCSIMIIPLDYDGKELLDDYFEKGLADLLHFAGPPHLDTFGKGGINAHFVEKFMEDINEKRLIGVVLKNLIQKDLIVTLEFSDDSIVIFDRIYKEIEENLDKYRDIDKYIT